MDGQTDGRTDGRHTIAIPRLHYVHRAVKMRRHMPPCLSGIAAYAFDSLHMVSYYRPIVTSCLKCTVFEIWWNIGRKLPKKPNPPSFGMFLWGDPLQIFRWLIPCQKLESWGYQTVYISRSCFSSARHNTGVWRPDGQTRRCRKDPR